MYKRFRHPLLDTNWYEISVQVPLVNIYKYKYEDKCSLVLNKSVINKNMVFEFFLKFIWLAIHYQKFNINFAMENYIIFSNRRGKYTFNKILTFNPFLFRERTNNSYSVLPHLSNESYLKSPRHLNYDLNRKSYLNVHNLLKTFLFLL
jgi:hypothetical protein